MKLNISLQNVEHDRGYSLQDVTYLSPPHFISSLLLSPPQIPAGLYYNFGNFELEEKILSSPQES